MRGPRALPVLLLALASLTAGSALAGEPPPDPGKALFDEGVQAMDAKDYANACAKFEASFNAGKSTGSLLRWADCEETRGRLSKALGLWTQGAAAAASDPARKSYVAGRIASLTAHVPHLDVKRGQALPATAKLALDGDPIEPGDRSVDPGAHTLVASVDGRAVATQQVTLAPGETKAIVIGDAAALPAAIVPAAPPGPLVEPVAPPPPTSNGKRTAAYVLGAVGLGGLVGFGITAGVVASKCSNFHCAPSDKGLVTINAVLLGVGVAGVGAGVVLFAISGKREASKTALISHGTDLALEGRF